MDWLNYHHLRYFWTVVRKGGLAPAAEELNLSPSTVSTQIQQLETGLGYELFDRSGRQLTLNEVGQTVLSSLDLDETLAVSATPSSDEP